MMTTTAAGTDDVPHLRVVIGEEDDIVDGAKKLIPSLKPDWDLDSVQFKIFTDGITNKLLGCYNGSPSADVILIRVYGNKTDLLIDRRAETRNFKLLNAFGLAPRLYATFETGLAYEYVDGETLTVETCRDDVISRLVARKLADMHRVEGGCGDVTQRPALWDKLRQFIDLVPARFSDAGKESRFGELFEQRPDLETEMKFLKEKLSRVESPCVFCHNDLLLGNIIYNRERGDVTFIDYEYAACNYQAFDIANHFNEFAGVDTVDYNLYPDEAFQRKWLRSYLERFKGGGGAGTPTEEDVSSLYDAVQSFTLASHFLWAVWSLIQAEYSAIDFDFLNYAFIRFREYYSRKSIIFGC